MTGFELRTQRRDTVTVLSVVGELDMASAPALLETGRRELASEMCTTLLLDLAELTFLDSTGVGCCVHMRNPAMELEKTVQLRAVPESALRILTIGGLASLFGLDAPHEDEGTLTT